VDPDGHQWIRLDLTPGQRKKFEDEFGFDPGDHVWVWPSPVNPGDTIPAPPEPCRGLVAAPSTPPAEELPEEETPVYPPFPPGSSTWQDGLGRHYLRPGPGRVQIWH